jgi:type I restriction enzyme S subunit
MSKDIKPALSKVEGLIPALRFPEFENEGEWEIKSFDKLFEIGNGRDYKHLDKGDIPVYGSGGHMLYVNNFLYDGESVCIGRKGTIDKPMFLNGKFWTVDTLFYTHSFKNCFPKYIYYLFQNIDWLKHNEAGGVPSLSKTNIYKIETAVPKPKEQQKIASCLSSLDEVIAAHSQKLELLKDHKKGLMQNLFPQEGETVPKYRFKEFEKDGDWVEKKLGDIAEIITGSTPKTSELAYYGGKKMFVSPADISDNRIVSQTKTTLTELGFSKTRHIKAGSVLFVCIGSTIGKVAQNKSECATNQQINSLVAEKDYSSDFLYSLLDANASQIASIAGNHAVPIINKSSFSDIKLFYPPSLQEQQKIASCLSSLDALITAQADKIAQLQQHKKGLMQGLFPKIND